MSAIETFLADFDAGKLEGRYLPGELPSMPFANGQFDIALSSHFLFLYSAHLFAEFHLDALHEMLRVSQEVRVFPLLTLNGAPSPHLQFVIEQLVNHGFGAAIKRVPYEFQRGGNEMLVIKHVYHFRHAGLAAKVRSYDKVRLPLKEIVETIVDCGLDITFNEAVNQMTTLIATKT